MHLRNVGSVGCEASGTDMEMRNDCRQSFVLLLVDAASQRLEVSFPSLQQDVSPARTENVASGNFLECLKHLYFRERRVNRRIASILGRRDLAEWEESLI